MNEMTVNTAKETKTVTKVFLVYDFDKEEQWLNEMAMQGWALKSAYCGIFYQFEKCEPGEYIIRLELSENKSSYISFLEEIGAECVGKYLNWVYMRRKSEYGEFELHSDIDSKISHLNRIGSMIFAIGLSNLIIGIMNSLNVSGRLGWINLVCSTLLMYCLGRIHGKKDDLMQERKLHE